MGLIRNREQTERGNEAPFQLPVIFRLVIFKAGRLKTGTVFR
jgi:hypothetical protein